MSDFLLFTAAFFIALFTAWKFSKEKLYSERVVFDAIILTSILTIIGARIFYVLFHFQNFGFNVLKWIVVGLYPGLSVGGAFLGAGLALWLLSDRKTVVLFPELVDLLTKTFLVVSGLLLIGFFFVSPEIGHPWPLPLFNGTHPVTLYRLLVLLLATSITLLVFRKRLALAHGTYSAIVWIIVITGYCFIDFFNQHDVYYWKLSVDQWIYTILILIITIVLVFQVKQKTFFKHKK